MKATLRLLLLGPETADVAAARHAPVWLPPFRGGRLLVGSAATADVRLAASGLLPFHCLVELAPGGAVLVHDLARRGDVLDGAGVSLGEAGIRLAPGERFSIAGQALALVREEDEGSTLDLGCVVCGGPSGRRARAVCGAVVCEGCLGVTDLDPFSFPGHELVATLGAGAMGVVYLARVTARDQLVALKVIRSGSATASAVSRFERETSVLASLDHPHIVRVLEVGSARAGRFIVCELVRGGDAAARLSRTGPFPAVEVARLGVEIAAALAYLLAHGIVHRDVKPANILLERDLTAKLADFGLSKDLIAPPLGVTTGSGATLGTLAYAAPEQLEDARRAGPAADVFSLGATLFHLATGRTPRQDLPIAQLRRVATETLPEAATIRPGVPRDLSDVLASALRPRPEDRPTATALGAALVRVLAGLRGGATR